MDSKKKKKILIILICLVLILTISVSICLSSINSNKEDGGSSSDSSETKSQAELNRDDEDKIAELKKVSESERIRTYLGEYFDYVEDRDYESAYSLLYDKFKENYFPTLAEYKEYMEESNYPEMLTVDYDNIKTQGYYYIVTLKVGDLLSTSDTTKSEKTFVIKEEDYNQFYLSFKL